MFDDLSKIKSSFEEGFRKIDELIKNLQRVRDELEEELSRRIEQFQLMNYNVEELNKFLEEPYCVLPKRKDTYWVIVPKFINFQVGWLEHETRSYYIYAVNRYVQWIAHVPAQLKKKLKFPEPPPFKVVDGMLLTGKKYQDEAWVRYRDLLLRREGEDRIRIKKGYEFELIAKLVEDGILPFIPQPVAEEDLRGYSKIKLRNYQKKAWKEFLDKGAVGIFWSFGAGKSLFGIYALARIKGRKLVVVPTLTLKEQWEERIQEYIPFYKDEITVATYHSYNKIKNREYSLVIFDEVHHLPAQTFIRLSTLKRKYTIGLSGSPFREDGREPYIFALTGFPVGLSWDELLKLRVVKKPTFKLYIVKNEELKLRRLGELLRIPVKTIVFCDSIELGKRIAEKFALPFVYGETKDRLDVIRQAQQCVVSRVGDEGLSLKDIERVIEVAFLAGSRMQESQRFGRLMHASKEEPEHIIIATEEEFRRYYKRFYAITERGFHIEIVR
jgi:DNA excision repair protein ERCC-3